jgi:hypothetical protein
MLYLELFCSHGATKSVLRTMPCHIANSYARPRARQRGNYKVIVPCHTSNLDRKIAEDGHFVLVLNDGRSGMDFSVHLWDFRQSSRRKSWRNATVKSSEEFGGLVMIRSQLVKDEDGERGWGDIWDMRGGSRAGMIPASEPPFFLDTVGPTTTWKRRRLRFLFSNLKLFWLIS